MKVVLSPIVFWRHDLTSCLQDCLASLLLHRGHDPVAALGAAWGFYYRRNDYRPEEYYYPIHGPGLAESVLPYHPVTSSWHEPPDPDSAWKEVRAEICAGRPALVAVDNYYLPFRPAFGDVHTNHLIVAYGFNDATDEVYVLDSKPPRFSGPVALAGVQAAQYSANPAVHDRDLFYTRRPIGGRWLSVAVGENFPELTAERVAEVVHWNLAGFAEDSVGDVFSGLAGLRAYLQDVAHRVAKGTGTAVMDELYVVGWAVQQSTALHADFLATTGRRLELRRLVEIGRDVDRLAHHWSDLRMLGAHLRRCPSVAARRIRARGTMLVADTERVLDRLEEVVS